MRTDAEAQKRVARMIGRYGFTEAVDRLEVNRGLVYRVWKFALYSPTVRRALKMPINLVPAPPCSDCGKVHTVPWCVQERGAPVPETEKEIVYVEVQPKPKPKRKSQPKRHRSHVEHGRGPAGAEHKARVQSWLDRNGWDSLTEAVDSMIGE